MSPILDYFRELSAHFGAGWNRFWFTPRNTLSLSIVRILTGIIALLFVISHTADLVRWFGPDGILNAETTYRLTGADQLRYSFHYSYLYLAETPASLWLLHILGLLVLLAFTLGLWSRVMTVGAVVVVLAYVHRAPLLTAQLEPVLTMVLVYLCLAPTGRHLSLDALLTRRKRQTQRELTGRDEPEERSLAANISTRLIQIHLAGLCLMIGLNMLAADVWWGGEAIWWLIARTESRLVNLTGLANWFLIVNVWTHTIVAFQLAFGLLVWNRLARPLLLALSVPVWISLALLTGLVLWCAMMVVASLAFIDPDQFRRLLRDGRSSS
jgi:hypothetical protein